MRRPFKATNDGVAVRLSDLERQFLLGLPVLLSSVDAEPDDPAHARLHVAAYPDDPARQILDAVPGVVVSANPADAGHSVRLDWLAYPDGPQVDGYRIDAVKHMPPDFVMPVGV